MAPMLETPTLESPEIQTPGVATTDVTPSTTRTVKSHCGVEFFCNLSEGSKVGTDAAPLRILVPGCGAGHEAAVIQQRLGALVEANDVDLDSDIEFADWPNINFQQASVHELPFENDHFDAVFYHHVIEHVGDAESSLFEIARVLKPGGWLFVGTPNRHRLVSSVGAHEQRGWQPTFKSKFSDNIDMWKARLLLRFRNERGEHAGFSQGELHGMLGKHFTERHWVTRDYLNLKYGEHRLSSLVRLATTRLLIDFAAPSVYAFCRKSL